MLRGERHTRERDAAAVRYHYDAGNEFFALFLDDSMTYSCALFSRGARTLEEAQRAKHALVAAKLGLAPGQRVLDVGCGWGAFALYAAREHGVEVLGVTLSREQAELARARVADAGLAERVEIRVADYRDLRNEQFDAIASIGMVEHVGEERKSTSTPGSSPVAAAARRGAPEPRGSQRCGPTTIAAGDDFTNRYVFPDGEPTVPRAHPARCGARRDSDRAGGGIRPGLRGDARTLDPAARRALGRCAAAHR